MDDKNTPYAFIDRWRDVQASELATAQSFVINLCELLGVPAPHPTPEQDYMFERPLKEAHGDGSSSERRIDCYKRGHFILEAKKIKAAGHTKGYDDALLRAHAQAQNYARALPAAEGRPPFLVVVDVGNVIQLFAEFSRSGGNYTPFPDPRSHSIRLNDLRDDQVRERLRLLWTDPMALDPSRVNARVTRQVATALAEVAKSLEADGHPAQTVAAFLTRCLFSMFAEDVGLLPPSAGQGAFSELLLRHGDDPATLQRMMQALWANMDQGGFSPALAKDILRFNGKLFKGFNTDGYALPLKRDQIQQLLAAARADWTAVEPAIFGTLLERALDPTERHALGAHYTPRAYVERLILPTVVDPLRAEWAHAQAAALLLANEANALEGKKAQDKLEQARAEVRQFHHRLCTVRVLDPACGSGNFLYVTLEHLKRIEGEVLNQLDALGDSQAKLGLEGETVTLQQLRGIEINPRAAALAELVLWIGYLQWQARTVGLNHIAEPVIHDYRNIDNRDAVLACDRTEPARDEAGQAITRWDGVTTQAHPVTGLPVPDERARAVQWAYVNPRRAEWPQADFIVGNPPFIGASTMRSALGDGYVDALRQSWPDVPESADFVMYWWHQAAQRVSAGHCERLGLITTNSIKQTFNRRVVQAAMPALSLVYAIPDHPWVDSADGAAVRIAMTVATAGSHSGRLMSVRSETPQAHGEVDVDLRESTGLLHADLRIGANVAAAKPLQANKGIATRGVVLIGAGFVITPSDLTALNNTPLAKPYRNGRDLTDKPRGVYAIDCDGMTEAELRTHHPAIWQWLFERVKPERDQNPEEYRRTNWWLFGRKNTDLRSSTRGLSRYIATSMTAKHRVFQFLDGNILADQGLIAIALQDGFSLGVVSSQMHVQWALSTGGHLGVGNDPRYNNSRCFDPFPFPSDDTGLTPELAERIRSLAEQLDAHRKTQQADHPSLTLTHMYNVLDQLRSGEALSAKDKTTHEQGLVSVLRTLHDELDAAVLAAYGWRDLGPVPWGADEAATTARGEWTDALLSRLVALNAQRAAEEANGKVRWLRPDFQDPQATTATQTDMDLGPAETSDADSEETEPVATTVVTASGQCPWPSALPAQIKAVADVLAATPAALSTDAVAAQFKGKGRWRERLPVILDTLQAIGRAQLDAQGLWRRGL